MMESELLHDNPGTSGDMIVADQSTADPFGDGV